MLQARSSSYQRPASSGPQPVFVCSPETFTCTKTCRTLPLFSGLAIQGLRQRQAVEAMDHIKKRSRIFCLIGLKMADIMP